VLGAASREAKRFTYEVRATFQNRVTARTIANAARRSGRGQQGDVASAVHVTADDIAAQEAHDLDKMAALTVAWHGFEDDNDQPVPFTTAAVRELYALNADILAQAVEYHNEASHFLAE
jgi:hypothetical protein